MLNFSLETNAAQTIMSEIENDLSHIGPSEIVDLAQTGLHLAQQGVDLADQGSSIVNTFSTYIEPLGTALQAIVAIMDGIADVSACAPIFFLSPLIISLSRFTPS